jgi:hypothetical protein
VRPWRVSRRRLIIERLLARLLVALVALPGAFALTSLTVSFAFDPAQIARGDHLRAFGISLAPCPGCALCGMSRAFSAWSHGQWLAAIELHAGVVLAWPAFALLAIVSAVAAARLWREPPRFFATADAGGGCR